MYLHCGTIYFVEFHSAPSNFAQCHSGECNIAKYPIFKFYSALFYSLEWNRQMSLKAFELNTIILYNKCLSGHWKQIVWQSVLKKILSENIKLKWEQYYCTWKHEILNTLQPVPLVIGCNDKNKTALMKIIV